jgi:7-carboxy-7-deazaguanine synthase
MRLLEHYVSVQGEGPRTGIPTQFVRFAGCNLRCPGWPCDTEFAIDPKQWRKEFKEVPARPQLLRVVGKSTSVTIVAKIMGYKHRANNVCWTGGEPLLQKYDDMLYVNQVLTRTYGVTTEMFTNGSMEITKELAQNCKFVMDWKLTGSGEGETFQRPTYMDTRNANLQVLDKAPSFGIGKNAVKFVCKDKVDVEEAIGTYWRYSLEDWNGDVYFGAVWNSEYLTSAGLVEMLLSSNVPNWRLNVQVHNYVWDAQERKR